MKNVAMTAKTQDGWPLMKAYEPTAIFEIPKMEKQLCSGAERIQDVFIRLTMTGPTTRYEAQSKRTRTDSRASRVAVDLQL